MQRTSLIRATSPARSGDTSGAADGLTAARNQNGQHAHQLGQLLNETMALSKLLRAYALTRQLGENVAELHKEIHRCLHHGGGHEPLHYRQRLMDLEKQYLALVLQGE